MKISFGIIALNGEPLVKYQLRALYPYAHQIIVAEGASFNARDSATPDGHSIDTTLETLRAFKKEEDPENKLIIVTAEDEGHARGFWPGEKDEQSRAYAKRATGDILWQVDIDEFYRPQDIEKIIDLLQTRPEILQINLRWKNFWSSVHYVIESFFVERHYREMGGGVPRIFRWGPDYYYKSHRPPTVLDADGRDLKEGMLPVAKLQALDIVIYHYSTLFTHIVQAKSEYHKRHKWSTVEERDWWFQNNFLKITRPYRLHHNTKELAWLERFTGEHPRQIQAMIGDLREKKITETIDPRPDVEKLLAAASYQKGIRLLKRFSELWLVPKKKKRLRRKLVGAFVESFYSSRT